MATTERNNARSSVARFVPKLLSNCACACAHALSPAWTRFSPALVNRSALARRSDATGSVRINPSRSSGWTLRASVVRSITIFLVRALTVSGPSRLSLDSIENWLVRSPIGARN
jgi:hypothetical protein